MLDVSYANSSALSPSHYRLVQAIERSPSDHATTRIIVEALEKIRTGWNKRAPSPATLRHDLLLALYCHHQLLVSAELEDLSNDENELVRMEWALLAAVQLAGRGADATEDQRAVGYRFCAQVFPGPSTVAAAPHHPLKLLLVNSIRSDLYAPPHSARAEARWVLGLRAAAAPTIAGPELAPAVADRVLEFLSVGNQVSSAIRRLALAAILNLLDLSPNERLLTKTRRVVLGLLMGSLEKARGKGKERTIPSSASSASSCTSSQDKRVVGGERNPTVLLALIDATRERSIAGLDPIDEKGSIVEVCLKVLSRVIEAQTEGDEKRVDSQGVKCAWLAQGVLRRLREEMQRGRVEEGMVKIVGERMIELSKWLEGKEGVARGLLLSICDIVSLIPTSALPTDFTSILDPIASALHSNAPNERHFALRSLRLLPPSIWSTLSDVAAGWGDKAWSRIMQGLEDLDEGIRKATIQVLMSVDPKLVELHVKRIEDYVGKVPNGQEKAKRVAVGRLMEVIEVTTKEGRDWAEAVKTVVEVAQKDGTGVLDEVVTRSIERFTYRAVEAMRASFALGIFESDWADSITLALVLAAVVHSLPQEYRQEAATSMATFLAGESKLSIELQEPFLLALLRLSASLDSTQDLRSIVEEGAKKPSFTTAPLFDLLLLALESETKERQAAVETEASSWAAAMTLPEWVKSFHRHLARSSASATATSWEPRPSSSESNEKPLKYASYASPTSTPQRGPTTISARAREREQHDLLRERAERGGKGGVGESLLVELEMTGSAAGRLALMNLQDPIARAKDEDEEGEASEVEGEIEGAVERDDEVDPFRVG